MQAVKKTITVGPDNVISIQYGETFGRPAFVEITYSDLINLMGRKQASRRSKTVSAKASRQISLMARAIVTGKWSTGALISRQEIQVKLAELLSLLTLEQTKALSPKAFKQLQVLNHFPNVVWTDGQQAVIRNALSYGS